MSKRNKHNKIKAINKDDSRTKNVYITKLPCSIGDTVYYVNWSTFDEEEDKPIVEVCTINGWKMERFTMHERINQLEEETGCELCEKEKDNLLKGEIKYEDVISLILDNGEEIEYTKSTFGTDLFMSELEAENFITECGY